MPGTKVRVARVTWRDSCSLAGPRPWWRPGDLTDFLKQEPATPLIHSVGHIVHMDKKTVIMAMGVGDPEGQFSDPFAIPRGCIEKIRYL